MLNNHMYLTKITFYESWEKYRLSEWEERKEGALFFGSGQEGKGSLEGNQKEF